MPNIFNILILNNKESHRFKLIKLDNKWMFNILLFIVKN